ncbi:MAG: carboxylating nicotinate-nucleotide diphosphorylase [Verrucomicrobiales bacterium]|nr:carboxylating nicotinate-nucleotide diphosphorylase [Verrucomicrobiales bacterium]
MNPTSLALVKMALEEDLRDVGDLTSLHFVEATHQSKGLIVTREEAVISGLEVAEEVCRAVDHEMGFVALVADGDAVQPGDVVCELIGKTRSILTAERTALNFLQRLSGVATVSRTYVEAIAGTGAVLLDTRKTTPGWRALEKAAVAHGGATNHRIGLYDAVMVKDNHLAANLAPVNLAERVAELRSEKPDLKIEVEADRLDQVEAFLSIAGIDVILLDNMSNEELSRAVAMRDEAGVAIKLEASGGVNLETIRGIAETGVDFISVGALTHSVRSIDLGLDLLS